MPLLISIVLFLAVATATSAAAMRIWLRPKTTIERVTGRGLETQPRGPVHPSLVFRDLLKRLGTILPASPRDVTTMQSRLIRAGIRNPNAVTLQYGAKIILAILLPFVAGLVVVPLSMETGSKLFVVAAAAFAGFVAPNEYVRSRARRRQRQIRRGLPNALDLLVVCVESGLGIDQAMLQTAKEMEHAHPEISEEFALVNLGLKAGKRRSEALHDLADRCPVEDLRRLATVLIQADRFGTSVGQGLRAHSDFMRIQARQTAEEKAAKLGVKLVFPIFFCILPSLFVITAGPLAVRIARDLLPMMNSM
jgi:tight adherence protein C